MTQEHMVKGHAGDLAWAVLRGFGVRELFTLNGAHIWPFYDPGVRPDLAPADRFPVYDTRHEQTAAFAAEAMAKLTRRPGVAALTAGPGVTNGISAITTAQFNGSPLVVLGGRAAQGTWGIGSLQEFDHVPVVAPITKLARTVTSVEGTAADVHDAVTAALTPHRGPVFLDVPIDVLFAPGEAAVPAPVVPRGADPDPDEVAKAAALLAGAERPMLIAGSDVWFDGTWDALRACVEALRVPTFTNGLGRGCLPADHELAFSRTRGMAKGGADVVVVVGTPLDFRVSFGRFGDAAVIHIADSAEGIATHVDLAAAPAGDLAAILTALAATGEARADKEPWIAKLRDAEAAARAAERAELDAGGTPIHPARVYGELQRVLDRDAVLVNDGGDFVSYAGKLLDSYEPGLWLDPGPYGCLGTGLGYALAARVAHPDRQVVALLGDGAFGFGGLDVDSLVRHHLPVVMVVGNNGIWGLEKHPMQMIYGYDAACDLQPATRYDDVVTALGGAGETVERPEDLGPALGRALASGVPYLVNVLTDPAVAYPRSSSLL